MLGATTTRSLVDHVSVPPRASELSQEGKRDWRVGTELIRTCMETHKTATYVLSITRRSLPNLRHIWHLPCFSRWQRNSGLSPEIVHFRIPTDGMDVQSMPHDWYIKGARYDMNSVAFELSVKRLRSRCTGLERILPSMLDIF
jgi:mannosyl-oligosaccharide alpha-1,2-mannosidase